MNTTDQNFDRSYSYDHAGRILEAKSGADVNGQQFAPTPYHETFGYDAFSNVTARQSDLWNGVFSDTDSASYTDNRRLGWGYDADGRNTTIDTRTYTFDAVGRQTAMLADEVLPNGNHSPVSQTNGYDANGAMIYEAVSGVTRYYLRSSVLGGAIVEEIGSSGQKNVGYVYTALGTQLATQFADSVTWKHNTPARTSQYTSNSVGSGIGRTEFDPLGADVPLAAPNNSPPSEGEGDLNFGRFAALMDSRWSDFHNLAAGCGTGVAAGCSGHMLGTNLNAEMLAFFGYKGYDLPGNNNELARGEARYRSIYLNGPVGGYDPEFNRYAFSVTVIYSSGATETKKNPTLDEYYQLLNGHLPDSSITDLENNSVTLYIGADFVSPQNPRAAPTPDPCAERLLVAFDLRDAGGEANINLMHHSIADDFLNTLLEINDAIPGGISFRDVFRDSAMQARRRAAYLAGRGAGARRPGTSSHEAGMAVDVAIGDVNQDVVDIFASYGFVRPFANEDWHFEADTFNANLIQPAQNYYNNCVQH